ncbi:hypothetical protein [Ramlibacter alkalitolerans]|uniref:Uncharacterized protein n=1 Tax=Ramlibacter alkalitolerans TaxID=2039631 RepID=A0ABS1JJC9_9BURK|nr:hypothetical protein [Ramlibacter alkalitolerans]MBL0424312.1 hypothetical protein [Ramlibacter alkalitolerans]
MQRKFLRPLAAVAFAVLAAGAAQARDNVTWSVGIDAAPGVAIGATNARPVMVAPAPVVVAPQPVYVAPRPVVVERRPVVVVQPEPVYVVPGHRGHKHHHDRHDRHDHGRGHGHGHGHD